MGLRTDLLEVEATAGPESASVGEPVFAFGQVSLYQADAIEWLESQPERSLHACVTDPPYGLSEYSDREQAKLRGGNRGGIWRIPPRYDGHLRSPLPRFTTMSGHELQRLEDFFHEWASALFPVLVPGAVVLIASNPLLSFLVSSAIHRAGFERRGEIIRLVQTLRGGDRPKGAHDEFPEVSVMPRSQWEPWVLFRKPVEGRVQDNLRKWGVGGFRRPSPEQPFGDVIKSAPTRKQERDLAPHPSLKPQALMRQLVRACLPLGRGIVFDPFAGGGSTLAAAQAVGYRAIGVERDPHYIEVAKRGIPKLAATRTSAEVLTLL
jgi:DNA modification methylase